MGGGERRVREMLGSEEQVIKWMIRDDAMRKHGEWNDEMHKSR